MLPSIELPSYPGPADNLLKMAKAATSKQFSVIVCIAAGLDEMEDTTRARAWKPYDPELAAMRCQLIWVSTSSLDSQQEWAAREGLGYTLLSDVSIELGQRLGLPTREVAGARMYKPMTLVVHDGEITQIFFLWTLIATAKSSCAGLVESFMPRILARSLKAASFCESVPTSHQPRSWQSLKELVDAWCGR
jgi:hypothetical protein